ncbi:uncharacterized protein LOC129001007 isoform X2 [Macrosteles quadrilineatus]|nr:uncharacterized protein LOC129001007 isoform X2 [Macrosteles quadrilineatus]
MNRLLETSDDELLKLMWSLVEGEGDSVTSKLTDIVNGKQLDLQSNLDGLLKFKIKFTLHHAEPSQFFEEVSCPLLVTLSELEKQQRLLLDIIKKKDLEIAEYKLEGAKISRGAVETKVFDAESFSNECIKELGATKGLVRSQPTVTITPLVQNIIAQTSSALEIVPDKSSNDELKNPLNCLKKATTKLKSPVKAKKSKMYIDDEEDDESKDNGKFMEDKNFLPETIKKEKEENENELESKPLKRITKPKVKKVLLNL